MYPNNVFTKDRRNNVSLLDALLFIRDMLETAESNEEYKSAIKERHRVFQEIWNGEYRDLTVRATVLFNYIFPMYLTMYPDHLTGCALQNFGIPSGPVLNPADFFANGVDEKIRKTYLPMFLRLFADKLSPRWVQYALDRIATGFESEGPDYGYPGEVYLTFATLPPSLQEANVARVAQHLLNIGDKYYIAKFFFYWRRIRGETQEPVMNELFFGYNLTDEWLDKWLENMRCENRKKIAEYKAMADAAGKPLVSPDSAIIKDRDGFKPQFIVLHSSGAGSPVERVCEMFLRPDCKVTAHFVVATDGRVFQLVDLKDGARTNKTDNNPESDTYYRLARHDFFRNHSENANNFTVTIECEEFGYHGAITEPQKNAILALFGHIEKECGIPIDHKHVIGHRDIAPLTRSYCPGSRFPIQELIERYHTNPLPAAQILSPAFGLYLPSKV